MLRIKQPKKNSCWELLAKWHSTTSQKTWVFSSICENLSMKCTVYRVLQRWTRSRETKCVCQVSYQHDAGVSQVANLKLWHPSMKEIKKFTEHVNIRYNQIQSNRLVWSTLNAVYLKVIKWKWLNAHLLITRTFSKTQCLILHLVAKLL